MDDATEATVAVVAAAASDAATLLRRLGPIDEAGSMTFDSALALQGALYDDGTFDDRAVFQVDRLSGGDGDYWGLVEPNGFRTSFESNLLTLADGLCAVSFFWNVNGVRSLLSVERGGIVAAFDPLIEVEEASRHGSDLPFDDHPSAAALALIERWTGVTIDESWFVAAKPTFVVQTTTRTRAKRQFVSSDRTRSMRFRARVEAWFDVDTLADAQNAADKMESAAFAALRPLVIPEPEHGSLSRTELVPMDTDALAALAADDLGPGISSVRFEPGFPSSDNTSNT